MGKVKVEVSFNEVRTKVREKLTKKYGSITEFCKSPEGEKFGGMKIRPIFYDTGVKSFQKIADLAKWLGIGSLKREIIVNRSVKYYLN